MDGDGDTDVLSASSADDKIAWYENTAGNGTAWTPRTITTAAASAWSVAAADVDGDGDQDVLSASTGDDKIAWYENTAGNGTTWTVRTITTAAHRAYGLAVADVDRDGDIDALSASMDDFKVAWFENTAGNGTAWTEHVLSTAVLGPLSVTAADVDADGDTDALAPAAFGDTVFWFENTAGTGTSWVVRTIAPAHVPVAAVAGDVDGDGDLDILSAAFYDNAITWHRNETIHETACFVTRPPLPTLAGGTYHVLVADLDGDGDRDVLASSAASDRVVWYRNASGGDLWTLHTIATADRPTAVYSADIDGDGDLDVLSVADQDDALAWHENVSGDGTVWVSRTISVSPPFSPLYAVAAGDLDGDGDQDVISSVGYAGQIAWYENTLGNGTAWTTHTMDLVVDLLRFARSADVDGDGDLDVLWASSYANKIAWYDNTAGNGTAWVRRTISTAAMGVFSVMPADVDGDGDLDAVAASFLDDKVAWHENADGIGQTWVEHTIVTTADPFPSIFPAELDRDGDTDVLSVSGAGGHPAWFENTGGDGSAWAPHVLSTLTLEASFMGAGDLDGDGDVDAVTASFDEAAPVAWHANGAGQFVTTVSDLAPPGAENGELVPMLGVVVTHAGRAGDGDLELTRLGLLFEEEPGDPLTTAEANAIIETVRIYRDADGNGAFDPGIDVLVTSIPTLALTAGVQVVTFADGNPEVAGRPGVAPQVLRGHGDHGQREHTDPQPLPSHALGPGPLGQPRRGPHLRPPATRGLSCRRLLERRSPRLPSS